MVGSILVVGALIHCALLYPMVGSILVVGALTTLCIATNPWGGSNAHSSGCTDYSVHCYQPMVGKAMHNVVGALTTVCIATNPWGGSNAQCSGCTDYSVHCYQPMGW